jgi:nicotinate-nucleotide adenylyltransferase
MKVGLFGGAFDPPHVVHRTVVEVCRAQFGLHRVVVLPSGRHPFKGPAAHAPAPARLALCRLAFVDLPWVDVSDHELHPSASGYTVDTLRAFRAALGPTAALYFLIGSDNVRDLPKWRQHHEALALAQFVIVPRTGAPVDAGGLEALDLTPAERAGLLAHVAALPPSPLSSTEVRRRLAAGEAVDDLLHPGVRREIERRQLYRPA